METHEILDIIYDERAYYSSYLRGKLREALLLALDTIIHKINQYEAERIERLRKEQSP